MRIEKTLVTPLAFPYSVVAFDCEPARIVVGPEKKGRAVHFALDGTDVQTIWNGDLGGVTGLGQLPGGGMDFLAIEGAYKGFNCEGAGLMHVWQERGQWRTRRLADLPFAHRMCVIDVGGAVFVMVATLCGGKDDRDDWSRPGKVYLARWTGPENIGFKPVIEGIHKNHGLFRGRLDGREVVLITGEEGVYEIAPPAKADGEWTHRLIMDEPISDVCVYDIDGDGEDELVAIRGFHGDEMAVFKRSGGKWAPVYRLPVNFGHFVWGGTVLGRDAVITGYRGANGALVLLRKVPGEWRFDIDVIDQLEAPINMQPLTMDGATVLFVTCGGSDSVVRYVLRE